MPGAERSRAERSRAERLRAELADAVGPDHVLVDDDLRASYEVDWTGRFRGPALCVVRPASAPQVSAVVRACAAAGRAVVVQGGNTGLVGGSVPPPAGVAPVVVSTTRLTALDEVDVTARQVTVGAGVTLTRLRDHVARAGLEFAVDFGARDVATLGGMIATNAGGVHVMAHGAMRAQVLGVQAVLADGSTVTRLGGLVKDNTGYDLSQLLVGSEGTLAIVTAARLRLIEAAPHRLVALLGVDDTAAAIEAVASLRAATTGMQAAELLLDDEMSLVCRRHGLATPVARAAPAYVLVELAGRRDPTDEALAAIAALDVDPERTAVAIEGADRRRLWRYRDLLTDAISSVGIPHKLDVSLPIGALASFEPRVRAAVRAVAPAAVTYVFGHLGDGNLHVNVVGPAPDDEAVDEAVLREVARCGGSISAEHGIGRAKASWLHLSRSAAEIAAMRAIKHALDPRDVLNPGVLLGEPPAGGSA